MSRNGVRYTQRLNVHGWDPFSAHVVHHSSKPLVRSCIASVDGEGHLNIPRGCMIDATSIDGIQLLQLSKLLLQQRQSYS